MKPDNEQNSIFNSHKNSSKSVDDSSDIGQHLAYDRILRSLGAMLEREGLMEFELQLSDDVYAIRGHSSRNKSGGLSLWEKMFSSAKHLKNNHQAELFECHYPVGEILQFEAELQALRKEDRRIPEPYDPSQILRGIAAYLDKREGCRLEAVSVKDCWVTINYIGRDGRLKKVCQGFEYFYEYGIRMFLQRSNRCNLPPATEPTLFVT